jgi:hypothetical protein
MAGFRATSFRAGLIATTIGSLLLPGFWLYGFVTQGGPSALKFADAAFWLPSVGLALLSVPLSCFGIGVARVLTLLAGVSLVVMLYIAGLATSI